MSAAGGEIILYFVRHGESVGNVQRNVPLPDDDVLTDKGKEQAENLGKKLAEVPFSAAFASDYSRTFETANLILKHSKHLSPSAIQKEPRLREQSAGEFEGKTYREVLTAVVNSGQTVLDYKPPSGENRDDVVKRVDNFLEEIFTNLTNEAGNGKSQIVLIVSHSFCLHHLMTNLGKSPKYATVNWSNDCRKLMLNTSYTKIRLNKAEKPTDGEKWKLEFLEIRDTGHLSAEDLEKVKLSDQTLKLFISGLGQVGEGLSGCIQS